MATLIRSHTGAPDAEPLAHGGDLGAARRLFPGRARTFIDLSTGINPHPYPLPRTSAATFSRACRIAPQPAARRGRRADLRRAVGGPRRAGAGHANPAAAVACSCRRAAPRSFGPTYAEHARAAALAGHGSPRSPSADQLAARRPRRRRQSEQSGRPHRRREPPAGDHRRAAARGGLLVVDEAFMDVGPPDASLAGDVDRGNIVVLRSFGKFFGLAGVRLGFALARRVSSSASTPCSVRGPWPARRWTSAQGAGRRRLEAADVTRLARLRHGSMGC